MSQHYTRRTQSVSKWCKTCNAHTQHRVDGGRVTRVCLECQEKEEREHKLRASHPEHAAAVQEEMFA